MAKIYIEGETKDERKARKEADKLRKEKEKAQKRKQSKRICFT